MHMHTMIAASIKLYVLTPSFHIEWNRYCTKSEKYIMVFNKSAKIYLVQPNKMLVHEVCDHVLWGCGVY